MNGLALAAALLATQQPPVFSTQIETVYVDVFATHSDRAVTGLTAEDFVVKDNGVAQTVEVVDRSAVPTTAVLVLDVSSSVAGEKLAHLKNAARAFLQGMAGRDEAALVTFNQSIELRQPPTSDRGAVLEALDRARPTGATCVIDALFLALQTRWGSGRPLVVLFTDGEDSGSWLPNDAILQAARESSALLYVVGTSPRDPESGYVYLLRRAAQTTGGAYLAAGSGDHLTDTFLEILAETNARYVLSYQPKGVARGGRHKLKVSVRRRGVKVRGRQEYYQPER